MGRKILFVTTDQQRYDSIGCNGGTIARTPAIDELARSGIAYDRAHPTNVVCMPSRASMITGQHVATHGVWMNGVPLPAGAPSVAQVLHEAGYRTGLFGKSHFEPFVDPFLRFPENRMGRLGGTGPHRGFERMELATHGAANFTHYGTWMMAEHPDHVFDYFRVLNLRLEVNEDGGGDTGAPQVKANPIPRGLYHTEWVTDRAIGWLDSLDADDDWFCWISFPDPHHPWDPPASETHRISWRDLDPPEGYPADAGQRERILDGKPRHWRLWYDGELVSNYEAPDHWVPATMTVDQVREVNALVHVENELIDEAIGRVLDRIAARGWGDDTDVIFTTDHGELQGDFGLLFKGPYHVDSLMRLPLIWRPAPSAGEPGGGERVSAPVSLLSLAPTFCAIAGVPVPAWMEADVLPTDDADATARGFERAITVWDSRHPNGTTVHLRTIHRDSFTCTVYEPGTVHDGTEGELYDLESDPHQHVNLWDDADRRPLRDDLVADLRDHVQVPAADRRAEAPV